MDRGGRVMGKHFIRARRSGAGATVGVALKKRKIIVQGNAHYGYTKTRQRLQRVGA